MHRFIAIFILFITFISCSKDDQGPTPIIIPGILDGVITEVNLTPIDITTPDKGTFLIFANNNYYKVDFNVVPESESNASLIFASDTILTDQSREFANLGKDAIAYNPVADNEIQILFNDGKKVDGVFSSATSFGGVFGEQLISQWRDPNDPAKPTQKAKDDLTHLVQRYSDKDGAGPETKPPSLFVAVSKK